MMTSGYSSLPIWATFFRGSGWGAAVLCRVRVRAPPGAWSAGPERSVLRLDDRDRRADAVGVAAQPVAGHDADDAGRHERQQGGGEVHEVAHPSHLLSGRSLRAGHGTTSVLGLGAGLAGGPGRDGDG